MLRYYITSITPKPHLLPRLVHIKDGACILVTPGGTSPHSSRHESVDLDPSELPCLYESDFDIEEDHQEINSERRVKEGTTGHIRTYQKEGSWQVVVSKPALSKKREPQSFYDVLSFWKCKEKGQET
ncbi:hypothetical protein GBA52_002748 [Prunus armeniaca]|nr:hypothetical protein GBA52_002748 [Prunus armeniaca]